MFWEVLCDKGNHLEVLDDCVVDNPWGIPLLLLDVLEDELIGEHVLSRLREIEAVIQQGVVELVILYADVTVVVLHGLVVLFHDFVIGFNVLGLHDLVEVMQEYNTTHDVTHELVLLILHLPLHYVGHYRT